MSSIKPRYAYADESGDAGFDFDANSSHRFVMGIVLPEQPEQLVDRLLALRRALGRPATFEFHFRQTDLRTRQVFFDAVREEPLHVLVTVIHKQYAPADFRRLGKLGIYSHALAGLSLQAPFVLSQCRIHLVPLHRPRLPNGDQHSLQRASDHSFHRVLYRTPAKLS